MSRIKVKVERGNGLQQVITVDTEATKGATLGTDVRLPSGAVATPATFLQWLGTTPGSSSGSGSSGPSISTILTTKGDLATRDTQVQRLPIGTQDQALRVSAAGMPEWRSGAALTKTDDTNVTLTLGGSPTTSLLAATSLTLGWTGQLGETRGGTAQSGYLTGDMLYASALNTLSKLGIGASGRWLGSSGSVPQWNAPGALTKTDDTNVTLTLGGSPTTALLNAASLTLGWTGQLAVSRGGTGKSALGTLSKTDDTNVTLTLGGTPTNSLIENVSLTLGWTGQLSATRGGTAQSGYLTGDILYASALNTLSKLGIGSSGNVLTVAGGVPTWAAPTGGASGANPTASVGLTAVNGVATTFLRSDGAPALDQSIAPTWTARHKYSAGASIGGLWSGFSATDLTSVQGVHLISTGADVLEVWAEPGGATNAKLWALSTNSGTNVCQLRTLNDATTDSRVAVEITRSGYAISTVRLGNTNDQPLIDVRGPMLAGGVITAAPSFGNSGLYSAVFVSGSDHYTQYSWYSANAGTNNKIWDLVIVPTNNTFVGRAANDAYNAAVNWIEVTRSGMAITAMAYGNSTDNPTHSFNGTTMVLNTTNLTIAKYLTVDATAGLAASGLSIGKTSATTANAGAQTLPANPVGFLTWALNGTAIKIPYYAN